MSTSSTFGVLLYNDQMKKEYKEYLAVQLLNHEKRQREPMAVQVFKDSYCGVPKRRMQYPARGDSTDRNSNLSWEDHVTRAALTYNVETKILSCDTCGFKCREHSFLQVMHLIHGRTRCPRTESWDLKELINPMFELLAQKIDVEYYRTHPNLVAPWMGSKAMVALMNRAGLRSGVMTDDVFCFACKKYYGKRFIYDHEEHLLSSCIYVKLTTVCFKYGLLDLVDKFLHFLDILIVTKFVSSKYAEPTYRGMSLHMKNQMARIDLMIDDFFSDIPLPVVTPAEGDLDCCPVCWVNKKNMALACGHLFCPTCVVNTPKCHICRMPCHGRPLQIFI